MYEYFAYSIIIFVLFNPSTSVKVNVDGTISVGKDIMDTLSEFFSTQLSLRRSMIPIINEDSITSHVRTAALCRDLEFCIPKRKFTEEYVIVMSKSIQTVLNEILNDSFKTFIFEGQLKHYLETVRQILESTNTKITEENEVYLWVNAMKKISAKFQEMSSIFISEEFQIESNKINRVKRDLNQKVIIATVLVETKYQTELCVEHDICITSFEVTRSFNMLLERFKAMPDEKVRLFMRYFYEALFETGFYSQISEATAHELQVILNDMAYSRDISTKELLITMQEVVGGRLESIKTRKDEKLSHDALLIHGILSDMDHAYSSSKPEPFADFFQNFLDWSNSVDLRLDKEIALVLQDIGKKLRNVPDDLLIKLINEVKVFLELTVDPVARNV